MSNPPQKSTDWEMWDSIDKELSGSERKRFAPVWLWLPIGLLASSLIGFYFGVGFSGGSHNSSTHATIHDTVYIENKVVHVDTFFNEKIVEKWISTPQQNFYSTVKHIEEVTDLNQKINSLSSRLDLFSKAIASYSANHNENYFDNLPGIQNYMTANKEDFRSQDNHDLSERIDLSKLALLMKNDMPSAITYISHPPEYLRELTVEDMVKMRDNKTLLNHLVPDYVNVGGVFSPGVSFNQEQEFGVDLEFGLAIELLFSNRFSIVSGISTRTNRTVVHDDERASNFPQPTNISQEDIFKHLKINSDILDIPIVLKYKLTTNKRLNQYLIAGVMLSNLKQIEYKYEYRSSGNTETYYEVKDPKINLSFANGILGYGLEYNASPNINLTGEAFLRKSITNPIGYDDLNGVGFKFGMFYKI